MEVRGKGTLSFKIKVTAGEPSPMPPPRSCLQLAPETGLAQEFSQAMKPREVRGAEGRKQIFKLTYSWKLEV